MVGKRVPKIDLVVNQELSESFDGAKLDSDEM
jgi:hypothetical protein